MQEQDFTLKVEKDQVICREGDLTRDLYKIISGKLMICSRKDHMVTPLAYLSEGDYFGEFSFFDNQTRSADVISVEPTVLIKIPQAQLKKQFPFWLIHASKSLTAKLRLYNEVIKSKGIKKKNVESVKALSIEEQRHYYQIISKDE
ncbi:MAG: cyclic nucleotide-binding domain-containing protein [Bacteriovoracaceae bacterium]|nr:cyclic nucleotide-binding domain-containing protein [Bacteriovoracaceae bacterium]